MTAVPVRLGRLPQNWQNHPRLVERYWDDAMKKIEKNFNLLLSLPSIQADVATANAAAATAGAAAVAAQASATVANSAATVANAAAVATATEQSLVNSFPSLFIAPLLSATSTGNIVIANHSRVYGDSVINPTVTVTGTTLVTGLAALSVVRIYYVDPSRAGGAVTYLYTVDPAAPPVQGSSTHSVGVVTIPAAGSANGNSVRPPGYVEP